MAPDASAGAEAIRAFSVERGYRSATLDRWLRLPPADAAALLALALDLRLGDNQLRGLWDWAEDVAGRDGVGLDAVLASAPVKAALERPVSRNDRLASVKAALRRLRFPNLAALEDRLGALVADLDLPGNVRVGLPDFLEGDSLRVEITAAGQDELRRAAASLLAAADSAACRQIFKALEEAP